MSLSPILDPQVFFQIPMFRTSAQAMSQPWMEGLGQSVGGMLTAAPGGGTGSDKAGSWAPALVWCFLQWMGTQRKRTHL